MPKRKALGPVDSSDGEEEEYFSTPLQSPFPKSFPNNFHGGTPSAKRTGFATSGPSPFSFAGVLSSSTLVPQSKSSTISNPINQSFEVSTSTTVSTVSRLSSLQPSTIAAAAAVAKKPRNSGFAQSMKDLNVAFVRSCRATISKNPSHSLIPLLKDYLYHSRVLMERGKEQNSGNPTELINGTKSTTPSKSFKSLGEFFEDFEAKFVEMKGEDSSGQNSPMSSVITNSGSLSTMSSPGSIDKLSKINAILNPSPPLLNADGMNSFLGSRASPLKMNTNITSVPKINQDFSFNKTNTISSTFSINTLQSSQSLSPAVSGSPLNVFKPADPISTTTPTAPVPFAGFSFFTNPAKLPTGLGSNIPVSAEQSEKNKNEDEGGDEEPPKYELTPIVENDSVYSMRCKVFGMSDGKYKDKGVGMLFIKTVEGGKHQVVVRADNNLGTVILNILLQQSLPLDKKSAKDIMTMDLQGNKGKGMPILLRVKSESDATELFNKLKEFQNS